VGARASRPQPVAIKYSELRLTTDDWKLETIEWQKA
jgi:hypothetical protein